MKNLTTNFLLAVIAVLLGVLLLRPFMGATPAQAQSPVIAPQTQPIMATDRGVVYILQDGKLSVYLLDNPTMDQLLPQAKKSKLKLLDTIPIKPTP